jgi:hypothetical protein
MDWMAAIESIGPFKKKILFSGFKGIDIWKSQTNSTVKTNIFWVGQKSPNKK